MNALGGRLLYVCCLLMINFGPSFRATSSVFYQCSFEQKSRTKCVHHIVQQEKKKNGNRSSTVQQQLSDSHSGPRRNISENIELMINKLHGLSPSDGLVSPSGGFASLFFDQVGYFASIKLCHALSRQGAIIKIPVVRCHYLLCSSAQ